jgi:endonuclease/exonuclease/phosphatase family metal-dependent hydrolase
MTSRFLVPCRARFLEIAVALLALAASSLAAPVRVTTWNLQQNAAVGATGWSPSFQQSLIEEAATTLAGLKPDVILLQQVAGWDSCSQLAKALRPQEYSVAVCSSFRDEKTGALSRQQVAILTKSKAYLSWPVSWESAPGPTPLPGGFAFAAIRVAGHNAGFFSVQFGDAVSARSEDTRNKREDSMRQLIRQIATFGNWATNRLESFLVGGDFNTTQDDPFFRSERTLPSLEAFGFANAFDGISLPQRVTLAANSRRPDATVDYIFSKSARQIGHPLISRAALTEHCAVTCEMDFSTPPAPRPDLSRASQPGSPVPANANEGGRQVSRLAGALAVGLTLLIAAFWIIRFWRLPEDQHRVKWQPSKAISSSSVSVPNTATFVVPPRDQHGSVAELTRWAKQKVVQRLVSDRTQLLATQQAAALKVLEVDERLSNLERQMQKRRNEYERRIDELLKELSTAREENRELIQAQIDLVKDEMEHYRLKT